LLYGRLQDSCTAVDVSIPACDVVKEWADIVEENRTLTHIHATTLVFDSYYMTAASRTILLERKIPFIGSVRADRFKDFMNHLKDPSVPKVDNPGLTAAIECVSTGELLVNHWDIDTNIGNKFVLSNAFIEGKETRSQKKVIPVYDHYKEMFNGCDMFNRALHDRLFPHTNGGNGVSGEKGHCHKFIMGALLQNVFNLWESSVGKDVETINFEAKCIMLSNALFNYATSKYD